MLGLVTGALIGAYTICDKQAVGQYGVPPLVQQWGTSVGMSALLAPLAFNRQVEIRHHIKRDLAVILAIGILVPMAYILVLTAMTFTPVSYIAPAREVSILFATIMGTHLLSEGRVARRIVAAVVMVFGLAALALVERFTTGGRRAHSPARTPKTHSWTARRGSRRTNRSSPSRPRVNSDSASDRFLPRPRLRRRTRCC